jgi:hypothetical protein
MCIALWSNWAFSVQWDNSCIVTCNCCYENSGVPNCPSAPPVCPPIPRPRPLAKAHDQRLVLLAVKFFFPMAAVVLHEGCGWPCIGALCFGWCFTLCVPQSCYPACSRTVRVAQLQVLLAPQAACSTEHGCAADPADADVRTGRRRPVCRDGRDARVIVAASERATTPSSRSCADAAATSRVGARY